VTKYGYTLFCEMNPATELVKQAQLAERAGFDFLVISDHYHPWIKEHTDSPFAWSVLGGVAATTERIGLGTLVTCPFLRYHPAVIAQAAATIQEMSGGRFTLGLGAGERLNEHVVGRGWPPADVRHEMLRESIEAIKQLWQGDYVTYRGTHITVEDARIFSMPSNAPDILVAASGGESAGLAAELSDGLVAVEPNKELIQSFESEGGRGKRRLGQVPISWDRDDSVARANAMRFKFGVPGWKVMSELPNPVNFDAAAATVREEDVLQSVSASSEAKALLDGVREFVDAGFDEVAVVQVGDDHEGFLELWQKEMRPELP
jgi:G6PDH family F420-dependent oxidoreductase